MDPAADTASIEAFRVHGVAVIRGLADAALVARLRVATDAALAAPGPSAEAYERRDGRTLSFGELQVWQRLPAFRDAVLDGPMARAAAAHMGSSEARFFYDQLLVKEPGSSRRTPWHQDNPYWKVAGRQICSLWLALDDMDAGTSLEFVRGSHDWPEHVPAHFADGTPYAGTGLAPLPDIEAARSDHDIVSHALAAGDALIFHAGIVHGAPGNASANRRRAYSTRWLGDDARYVERPGETAFPSGDVGLRDGDRYAGDLFPLVHVAGRGQG